MDYYAYSTLFVAFLAEQYQAEYKQFLQDIRLFGYDRAFQKLMEKIGPQSSLQRKFDEWIDNKLKNNKCRNMR